jgi:arginase
MKQEIEIIGVPVDLGQTQRGVEMGPSAIRYAKLQARLSGLGFSVTDRGNIPVPVRDSVPENALVDEIRQASESVYQAAVEAIRNNHMPVFLGGDHSIAIGTVGGVTHDEPAGLIWVDAHGDFNTPVTSPSGNIHGMSLAALTGDGLPELVNVGRKGPKIKPEDVVVIGVRQLDPVEKQRLRDSGITVFTMRDIDEEGINIVARKALAHLNHLPRLHVSLDIDSLDPKEAPGVGTPVNGGLTLREAHLLMEILADSERLCALDIVEINPILDHQNQTATMAVDLAISLFGRRII